MCFESKSSSSALCTILVPLKDNPHRTKHFLQNNIFVQFQYLFADGSFGNENEILINSFKAPHVKYIRYQPDATLESFLVKMESATIAITTPFAVLIDAGDYLSDLGVEAALTELMRDSSAVAAGGDAFFTRRLGFLMTKPFLANSASRLSKLPLPESMIQIRQSYCHLWYAVQRSEALKRTWSLMASEKFRHPFMEYFPTISTLTQGHYIDTSVATHLRVVHGPKSWTKQPGDFQMNTQEKGSMLDTAMFAERCGSLFSIQPRYIMEAFERNAQFVYRQIARQTLGPIWFQRLMPSEALVERYPILSNFERTVGYYAGLIMSRGPDGHYFSIRSWLPKWELVKRFRNNTVKELSK